LNALNPKVDLLIKLAQMYRDVRTEISVGDLPDSLIGLLSDRDLIDWYCRMAELKYVPEIELSRMEQELMKKIKTGDGKTRGYQIFATPREGEIGEASYVEAGSMEEAFRHCFIFFPQEHYHSQGIKDIQSQVVKLWDPEPLNILNESSPPALEL
jgi:hypothetical protein